MLIRKCYWLIWKVNQAKISLSDIWKSYATYKKKVNYVCAVTVCWKIGLCIVFRIIFWCYKFPLHSGMTFSSAFNLPFTTNHITTTTVFSPFRILVQCQLLSKEDSRTKLTTVFLYLCYVEHTKEPGMDWMWIYSE